MLTKAQWDKLSPQQQYDLYQSLAFEVESAEAERFDPPDESAQAKGLTLKEIKDRYLPNRSLVDLHGNPLTEYWETGW